MKKEAKSTPKPAQLLDDDFKIDRDYVLDLISYILLDFNFLI